MNTYTVQPGDTLTSIAAQVLGPGHQYGELLPYNPQITDPNVIQVGEVINYPAPAGSSASSSQASDASDTSSGGTDYTWIIIVASVGLVAAGWYFYKKK